MYTTHSNPNSAHTVAVATPCCPAPVSATTRCLPMRSHQQRLTQAVVDLVRAGVQQVFALQINLRPAEFLRQPPRKKQRRRPPRESLQQFVEPRLKRGSFFASLILLAPVPRTPPSASREHSARPTAQNARPGQPASVSRTSPLQWVPHLSRLSKGGNHGPRSTPERVFS